MKNILEKGGRRGTAEGGGRRRDGLGSDGGEREGVVVNDKKNQGEQKKY